MIETQILGSAVGIQRQKVIDKTESTPLPSLTNGVIIGRFKRGRMDKPFKVTSENYQALLGRDPKNASYLAVEDAFKRGVSEVTIMRVGSTGGAVISCQPIASPWSKPITFDMVNRPTSNGGIQVAFGTPSEAGLDMAIGDWVNLSQMSTIEEFFAAVNETIPSYDPYQIGVKSQPDGSVLIRVEPKPDSLIGGNTEAALFSATKADSFYVYDDRHVGTNAEAVVNLSNAFDDDVIIYQACLLPLEPDMPPPLT